MKTMKMMLVACLMLSGSALAETKLWTWKPKTEAYRALQSAAMESDGSAVIVLGESVAGKNNYRIVWLDSNGRERISRKIPTGEDFTVVVMAGYGPGWEASFLGKNRIRVSGGGKTRIYSLNNGRVEETFVDSGKDEEVMFFPTGGFGGYLKKKTALRGQVVGDNGDWNTYDTYDIVSLSAWKP